MRSPQIDQKCGVTEILSTHSNIPFEIKSTMQAAEDVQSSLQAEIIDSDQKVTRHDHTERSVLSFFTQRLNALYKRPRKQTLDATPRQWAEADYVLIAQIQNEKHLETFEKIKERLKKLDIIIDDVRQASWHFLFLSIATSHLQQLAHRCYTQVFNLHLYRKIGAHCDILEGLASRRWFRRCCS